MFPDLVRRSLEFSKATIHLDVPASSESVLDHSLAGNSQNPYWGVLWQSAVPMAEFLLNQDWPPGGSAIELGSGLGLTGIAARMAGLPVTMTDIIPEAVELCLHNAKRNGVNGEAHVLDWNERPSQTYDTIIACDVLYERVQHAGLLQFLKSASHDETQIYLGDPGRQSSQLFLKDAKEAGFHVEQVNSDARTDSASQTPVRIYRLTSH